MRLRRLAMDWRSHQHEKCLPSPPFWNKRDHDSRERLFVCRFEKISMGGGVFWGEEEYVGAYSNACGFFFFPDSRNFIITHVRGVNSFLLYWIPASRANCWLHKTINRAIILSNRLLLMQNFHCMMLIPKYARSHLFSLQFIKMAIPHQW